MEPSPTHPYLTATLCASNAELDLSGSQPFNLELVITLHASKPVILYTADTFLSPQAALRQGGIDFTRQGEPTPEPRSTIHVNRGNNLDRPWTPHTFLALKPRTPTRINILFGPRGSSASSETRRFNPRLWINTTTFETNGSYTALLPSAVKVSWWRWAAPCEVQYHLPAEMQGFSAAWCAVRQWWISKEDFEEGVPILAEGEQLPIRVVGDRITFTCVGQRVEPVREQCYTCSRWDIWMFKLL